MELSWGVCLFTSLFSAAWIISGRYNNCIDVDYVATLSAGVFQVYVDRHVYQLLDS